MYSWFGERMSVDIRIVGEIENEIMSKVRKLVGESEVVVQ